MELYSTVAETPILSAVVTETGLTDDNNNQKGPETHIFMTRTNIVVMVILLVTLCGVGVLFVLQRYVSKVLFFVVFCDSVQHCLQ